MVGDSPVSNDLQRLAGPSLPGSTGSRLATRAASNFLTARRRLYESLHFYRQILVICLLLNAQNGVFGRFSDAELNYRLSRYLDLLLGFRIDPHPRFPLLFYQLAEAGQHKFAVLLNGFISEATEAIEEKGGGSFVGLSRRCECVLEFGFGHL